MTIEWRASSAVQRPTHVPQAPSRREVLGNLAVVGGQVVLGEQIGEHRSLGVLTELGLLGIPVHTAHRREVAAVVPWNIIVRVPVLGHRQVSLDLRLGELLQFVQQFVCRSVRGSPCARLSSQMAVFDVCYRPRRIVRCPRDFGPVTAGTTEVTSGCTPSDSAQLDGYSSSALRTLSRRIAREAVGAHRHDNRPVRTPVCDHATEHPARTAPRVTVCAAFLPEWNGEPT